MYRARRYKHKGYLFCPLHDWIYLREGSPAVRNHPSWTRHVHMNAAFFATGVVPVPSTRSRKRSTEENSPPCVSRPRGSITSGYSAILAKMDFPTHKHHCSTVHTAALSKRAYLTSADLDACSSACGTCRQLTQHCVLRCVFRNPPSPRSIARCRSEMETAVCTARVACLSPAEDSSPVGLSLSEASPRLARLPALRPVSPGSSCSYPPRTKPVVVPRRRSEL